MINRLKSAGYILLPIGIALYIFYPLLRGYYLYPFAEYELYKSFMVNFIDALKDGELLLWNEYVGSGHPALYFGHYPITQNTIIYMLFGFNDFTFYMTKYLGLIILLLSFIYACRYLRLGYLISLSGALTYFSINFVIRVMVAETIGNLLFVYPLLVIYIIKIIDENKKKDILIFNLFHIFWLSGGHIIYVYMHLMMLSLIFGIAIFVFHRDNIFKLFTIKKIIKLYFVLFIVPCLAVLYQYYFILDVIAASNRFKEGLIVSPFESVVWKQFLVSFQSSSYFWVGLLSILLYAVLKLKIVKYDFVEAKIRITALNLILILAILSFLTMIKFQFISNSNIVIDYIPILNSKVFRAALILYLFIHLILNRTRYDFSIGLNEVFLFILYMSLLSYYFFSPLNIIGDVNGYDYDLFRELSVTYQIIFTLCVLFSLKSYQSNKIVKIAVASLVVLYLIRSHFTIPLLRFTGIVWYATRDGSIFSCLFAILFMFGLNNILTLFHDALKDADDKIIKYIKYGVLFFILVLFVQNSFSKFYKGTSHRFIYPNRMEMTNTSWEKFIIEGREQIPLLNNKLLKLNEETKHFYRIFSTVNSYLYLAGNLQQYKIHEAIIYDSSIARELQDFCDYTILGKPPSNSKGLKDAMPYFLFTRHVHAGLNLDYREIPYRDVFVLDPERDIQYIQKKNIEFLWDLMQIKYLIIESKLSIALEGFANKEDYKQLGNYNKLGFNLYEILRNKNYSRMAILPIEDYQNYDDVIREINSKNVDTLKDLYSRLVYFGENTSDFSLLNNQNSNNRRSYEIISKKKGILIEFESWHRNWRLTINNDDEKLQKAFQIFRGIKIHPGLNRIELVYHLKYFKQLFQLSIFIILTHIVLIGILWAENMDKKRWKIRIFTSVYFLIIILVLLVGIELTIYIASKTGRLTMASKSEILAMSKGESAENKAPTPVYIPHPYFGYIYNPSNRVSQFNYVSNMPVYMDSNSEGFIDEEFPLERQDGLCVYGILGGSGAMSWGVDKRENRIAYKLEKLLNTYLINNKCREYRVLNMGVGSHLLYQATQVYLYYKNILDGVIFYGGFNECAHGAMLPNDDPVQFPVHNLYASLQIPSPLIFKISDMQQKLMQHAKFLMRHSYLIYSPSVRFFFRYKVQKIEKLQRRLQDEERQTPLPSIKGKFKRELRSRFPWVSPTSFLQSFDYDNPEIPKVMEKILPMIWTDPTLNTYILANTAKAHFLSVIQPLMYITGKDTKWRELNYASYHFQKCCVEKLKDETAKLKPYGIKTYNLNEINKEEYSKDFFIDQAHLNNQGTDVPARVLFKLIKNQWHN